ncbi:MAG: anti-sigma factor [Acidobacteria bacterium]|nr:anti-sigma factor [Acidobacteriota bacterium]
MTEHLSAATLSALADGELSSAQMASVNEHLAACPPCTSNALAQALLKTTVARTGQRYTAPPGLKERLAGMAKQERERSEEARRATETRSSDKGRWGTLGWGAAAAVLFLAIGAGVWQRSALLSSQTVSEVCDQHIATLAANAPPQVISSDRHTVKPWFQGKLPFSFNLPENLPADTTLDGANLTYLHNRPVAQLLYSLGKHRVSVFVQQRSSAIPLKGLRAERSGFHVDGFVTGDLEAVAVSDADQARLADLVSRIRSVQTK